MKILKRNYIHRNLILFLISSVAFQAAIKSISSGQSLVNHFSTLEPSFLDIGFWLVCLLSAFFVYKVYKFSDKLVILTIAIVSIKNFYLLSISFNKLVLALSFIYLLFAFYFYITWELELNRACFVPKFNKKDLIKSARAVAKVIFKINEVEHEAYLTNMDDNSAFIIFNDMDIKNSSISLKKKDNISLSCKLEGVNFEQNVRIVTTYDLGVGVEYLSTECQDQLYDYPELFQIYLDRGVFI